MKCKIETQQFNSSSIGQKATISCYVQKHSPIAIHTAHHDISTQCGDEQRALPKAPQRSRHQQHAKVMAQI
jgi:hypothetical protein